MWSPPPDPDKPSCPYKPGFEFQITEHEPPPPFGPGGYTSQHPPFLPDEWLEKTPQTQQVLECPPQETQWPSGSTPRNAVFTITHTISIGNERGAQLVGGHVLEQGEESPQSVTAKIYDPLYYPTTDDLVNIPVDVAHRAERDYSRESAAYKHLEATQVRQKPGFAPQFYGSWTFQLPLTSQGKTSTRSVRLILIESLDGSSMLDLYAWNSSGPNANRNAVHYDLEYRLNVFAEILDGHQRQLHSGLDQHDLSPRNVMIVPSPKVNEAHRGLTPRVVLIDYNTSVIPEQTKWGRSRLQDLERPLNPAQFHWICPPDDFQGWLPLEWYDEEEEEGQQAYQEWLLGKFGGDQASNYEPIKHKKPVDIAAVEPMDDDADKDDGADGEYLEVAGAPKTGEWE